MDNPTLGYALIVIGLLLMAVELLFFTVFISVLSVCALIVGLTMVFAYDTSTGVVTALGVFVAIPVLFTVVTQLAQRTRMGRRLFLAEPSSDETIANMPTHVELEQLRGRHGLVVAP